ncbi:histidine phosphatase family protein [Planctomonas psychrotolerans]|uniref:histidine phosphatase family protein n=1 Tax=Planctomonas psychrotolerans TaxID=2528712 RepID=UPI0012394173|nr:histidine phosphatase family protein [Planctomonas psychrotolerans]
MRLILIRHGQTTSNVGGHLDTSIPGADLTPLGREQAAALPPALAGEEIGALFASNQVRAQQTARPLADALGLEIGVREGVREVSAGDLEMRNDREAIDIYLTTVMSWAAGRLDVRMPGGEDGHEAFSRFTRVVDEVTSNGHDTVAIVSHGAMIRAWVAYTTPNVDVEWVAERALTNTGVAILTGSSERGWVAESWIGEAVGGDSLTDTAADGPAADAAAADTAATGVASGAAEQPITAPRS